MIEKTGLMVKKAVKEADEQGEKESKQRLEDRINAYKEK